MAKTSHGNIPSIEKILIQIGENIKLARLRRKISAIVLANRCGMTRTTLRHIENGDYGVSFGAYATVLFSLGLENDLKAMVQDDVLGRKLQDIELLSRQDKEDEAFAKSEGKMNAKTSFRRAKLLNAIADWLTIKEINEIEALYVKAAEMTNLGNERYHVDHIIPLQGREVSGLHILSNLQILTEKENLKKNNAL